MLRFNQEQRARIAEVDGFKRDLRKADKKARPKSPKADRGRERDNAHLAFIRRLPCVATWAQFGRLEYGCQAAHVRMVREGKPGGMGVKPSDRWTVPLTPSQHDAQTNRGGERGFWSALGIDPISLAERLYAVTGDHDAAVKVIKASRSCSSEGGR